MKASQLRDLSRRYASGAISREDYLARRRQLIDGITRGDIQLTYRELDPPGTKNQPTESSGMSRTAIAAAALVLILLLAFGIHFLAADNGPRSAAPPAVGINNPANLAVDALEAFAARDDWSDESLESLESRWTSYSPAQRRAARGSVAYRRLGRETQTRIREHEALVASGGDPKALQRAARLRIFAERLGFMN